MATAASDKPASAPEDATARPGFWRRVSKPVRFLRRIPRPLLITFVGLALSAWLLPAITRQWDDRQKARDLQASLIEDMSSASARALVAGVDAMRTSQPSSERLHQAERDWQIAGVEVQARLKAYFAQKVVQSWENYRLVMSTALWAAFHREVFSQLQVGPNTAEQRAWDGLAELKKVLPQGKGRFKAYRSSSDAVQGWGLLESDLELLEYEAEHDVLAAHPRGYSTTWRDLSHDLIP